MGVKLSLWHRRLNEEDFNSSPEAVLSFSPFNLDLTEDRVNHVVITATGSMEESMACFKMLTQLMGLPFRRDAIEKTMRDALRQKTTNTANVANLQQHGTSRFWNKGCSKCLYTVNVPCLINWEGGFGLVVQSNSTGLLVAHPRLGWLELTPKVVSNKLMALM